MNVEECEGDRKTTPCEVRNLRRKKAHNSTQQPHLHHQHQANAKSSNPHSRGQAIQRKRMSLNLGRLTCTLSRSAAQRSARLGTVVALRSSSSSHQTGLIISSTSSSEIVRNPVQVRSITTRTNTLRHGHYEPHTGYGPGNPDWDPYADDPRRPWYRSEQFRIGMLCFAALVFLYYVFVYPSKLEKKAKLKKEAAAAASASTAAGGDAAKH